MLEDDVLRAVVAALDDRTITTAESVTAGRIATGLASVESAVEFFRGGLVAYQTETKRALLGVTADSVLSEEAATQMAAGACALFGADVAVSTTGLAGFDAEDGVEPGTVFIGTCIDGRKSAVRHMLEGEPEEICERATQLALRELVSRLGAYGVPPAGAAN